MKSEALFRATGFYRRFGIPILTNRKVTIHSSPSGSFTKASKDIRSYQDEDCHIIRNMRKKRSLTGLWIEDEGCYEMICKNYRSKYIYAKLQFYLVKILNTNNNKKFRNNRQEQKQAKGTWHQILCLYW